MHELGTFVMTYPLWALVKVESVKRDENGNTIVVPPIQIMVIDDTSGGAMLPLFTDHDLATRYKKASDETDEYSILPIETTKKLVETLRLVRCHADTLTLDKPHFSGKPYAIWPIDYAIAKIEAGEDL